MNKLILVALLLSSLSSSYNSNSGVTENNLISRRPAPPSLPLLPAVGSPKRIANEVKWAFQKMYDPIAILANKSAKQIDLGNLDIAASLASQALRKGKNILNKEQIKALKGIITLFFNQA